MTNTTKEPLASMSNASPAELLAIPAQAENKVNITLNLRNISLLAQLTEDEMATVKAQLAIRGFSKRSVVLQKGIRGDSLMLLLSGQLQAIDLTEEGRVIGLSLLSPGSFFGEIALINNTINTTAVVALSDALIAFLPSATALHLFTHAPSVAQQIQQHLAQRVQRDHKFRALLSINNTSKRIASFLALMKQKTAEKQDAVENLPTHQEIANMINTSRETVTRTLLMLMQQGIIRKDAHRLIIVKPDVLQKLTESA